MKRDIFSFFAQPTIRVACSYMAIIMVLSISFSAAFYGSSAGTLHVNEEVASSAASPAGSAGEATVDIAGDAQGPVKVPVAVALRQGLTSLRSDLLKRLVFLNAGALVVGAFLSFYLARRTLRPIEAALEAQTRFAADASHELRTPLTTLITETEVVLCKPHLTLPRAKAALQSNLEEATKLKQLAEALLGLAGSAASPKHMSKFDISEAANQAINHLLAAALAKDIIIQDKVPKIMVYGDMASIARVLIILLDNAIKYSPAGTRIHISAQTAGRQVEVKVRDEGGGIDPADLPHIFERFYRSKRQRKNMPAGHGLGLSIARSIIRQHGGEITAINGTKGAVFVLTLSAEL